MKEALTSVKDQQTKKQGTVVKVKMGKVPVARHRLFRPAMLKMDSPKMHEHNAEELNLGRKQPLATTPQSRRKKQRHLAD